MLQKKYMTTKNETIKNFNLTIKLIYYKKIKHKDSTEPLTFSGIEENAINSKMPLDSMGRFLLFRVQRTLSGFL